MLTTVLIATAQPAEVSDFIENTEDVGVVSFQNPDEVPSAPLVFN